VNMKRVSRTIRFFAKHIDRGYFFFIADIITDRDN